MTQAIEMIVSPTGQTTVKTKGFVGASCRGATGFLEAALGQRTGEVLTAEFHQQDTTQQQSQKRHEA